jgi:hypothetical protein
MVSVLPPLTTFEFRAFCHTARRMPMGSTPGCHQKRLSSNATTQWLYLSGKESVFGKRHWPSAAICAPSKSPLRSSNTALKGASNKGRGRQNSHNKSSESKAKNILGRCLRQASRRVNRFLSRANMCCKGAEKNAKEADLLAWKPDLSRILVCTYRFFGTNFVRGT